MEINTTSTHTLTIHELRKRVRATGCGEDAIRKFGDLRRKRTWYLAYRAYCTPRLSESDRKLLFGEPQFKSDSTGQLLLFETYTYEPPDPDDYKTINDFNLQWQRWEAEFSEYAAALKRWAKLECSRSPPVHQHG